MSNPQPETLNGQQITALASAWQRQLSQTIAAMELRRFAITEAAKIAAGAEVMPLAKQISDFLTEPAANVRVRVEG